jgi:hypothetical protein
MSAFGFASLVLMGCGDGLVTEDYRGDALFTLAGQVIVLPEAPPTDTVRISVMWIAPDGKVTSEQSEELITEFPAQYWLTLFVPPPDEALNDAPAGVHARGAVVLFLDENGDDRWDPLQEPTVGSSVVELAYLPEPILEFEAGFHVLEGSPPGAPPDWEKQSSMDPSSVDLYIGLEPPQ